MHADRFELVRHRVCNRRLTAVGARERYRPYHDRARAQITRELETIGLEVGQPQADADAKKQAEVERDAFLAKLNAPTEEVAAQHVAAAAQRLVAARGVETVKGKVRATIAAGRLAFTS